MGVAVGLGVGAGVGTIVGVAEVPEPGVMVDEAGRVVVTSVGLSLSLGKGVGRTVGSRVLKATGVTRIGLVAEGVGSPNRLEQPERADSRITRDIRPTALRRKKSIIMNWWR